MDPVRFDRLAKTLSTPDTRRGALRGLLAGMLSLLGLAEAAAGRRKRDRPHPAPAAKKRRNASVEGPCGDGRGKANACTKDRDCCTRFCDKKKGRCRCKKLGRGCSEDRQCCATAGQPMTCQSGRCRAIPPPCGSCGPCQTCDPATGQCVNVANGTGCDDGNDCTVNDVCTNGVCAGTPVADGDCCADGLCVDGACAERAPLAMCEGRCDSEDLPAAVACTGGGPAVPCPSCDGGCAANGCADGGSRLHTPEGESFYCVTSVAPTTSSCQSCPTGAPFCLPPCDTPGELCTPCPAGEGCFLVVCMEICTGE